MRAFWYGLSEAGGLTPVAVLALCVSLLLAITSPAATTRRWIVAGLATALAIGLAKMVFIPCGAWFPDLRLRSPSGHVAGSVAIYGGLAALLWRSRPGWLRVAVALAVGLLCLGIAISRVEIRAHSVSEVIVGGLIGLIVPVRMLTAPGPKPDLTRALALSGVAALPVLLAVLMLPGVRLSSEPYIQTSSRWLGNWSGFCPTPTRALPARKIRKPPTPA